MDIDLEQNRPSNYLVSDYKNISPSLYATTRMGFVQKVYSILSVQLLVTVILTVISMNSHTFAKFQLQNIWLFYLCLFMNIVIMIILMCFTQLARQVPTNYILLFLFTFGEAYTISIICVLTSPRIVLLAATMTLGLTIALTLYAMYTKTDFTTKGGLMYMIMAILFVGILFKIFVHNSTVQIIISALFVFAFGIYLIYDTQQIIGGFKYQLDIDDYIIGALVLYVDIITLFIELLSLFQETNQ